MREYALACDVLILIRCWDESKQNYSSLGLDYVNR